ncbi:MAG: vitamin K epoxide reductase family protein [Patescibacteria group bacterium]
MQLKDFIHPKIFLYFSLLLLGTAGFFLTLILAQPLGFYVFVSILALGGLIISITVYYVKKNKKQLVCPTGSDCNAVITSRYSKFLGLPLEYLGMAYFLVVLITYIIRAISPGLLPTAFQIILLMITVSAFLFSFYLLFIQAFLLRQWCIWCVLTAMFSITIFLFSLIWLEAVMVFLASIVNLLLFVQFLGFILGMGISTAACLLFVKFLKDTHIDVKEQDALNSTSQIIWLGIFSVIISQFALFVAFPESLGSSSTFIAKTTSIFIVAISTAILMIIFAPLLVLIPFGGQESEDKKIFPLRSLRRPALITGAITLVSWYFAFATNYLPEYSLAIFFIIYLVAVLLAVIWSLFYERKLSALKE